MERNLRNRSQNRALQSWVDDQSDPHLPRVLATRSSLPHNRQVEVHGRQTPQPRSQATSMLMSASSEGTRHNSLPALTIATSRTTSSVASSIGVRQLENQQRMLDLADGDVLVVPPLQEQRILECPFNVVYYCLMTFANEEDWIKHSLTHFCKKETVVEPPTSNACCFCDKVFNSPRPCQSWAERMRHVCLHHCLGHRLAHARPDFALYKYLFNNHLISDGDYRELKGNSHGRAKRAVPNFTPPTSPNSPDGSNAGAPVYAEMNRGRREDRRPQRRR